MSIEVKVPPLPESVSEATVVSWHKQPGDAVKRDENLVDLETDKVVLEVPAPADGVLGEILKTDGDTVTSGELLATLEEGGAAASKAEAKAPAAAPSASTTAAAEPAVETNTEDLSPAVRRMIEQYQLNPEHIQGTGRGGRITKEDVLNYLESVQGSEGGNVRPVEQKPELEPSGQQQTAGAASVPAPAASAPAMQGERPERRVPMTRLRQRIAERLVEAQHTAAMLTTFNEVDMKPVMDLRNRYKDRFAKSHDVKLGFMSFFVKAAIEALKRFPAVNASIDGNDIIYHGYYDIGIAVSTPRGLVVPIVRDADQMSFADIEKSIEDLGKRGQAGKLGIDELTGGTFSITNGGIFGSLMSTPILNPPQSAILGMHAIKERPMVVDGEIQIRPMMYLALTYDHRIIDGREAVSFLVTIKDMLEDPARLLLEV